MAPTNNTITQRVALDGGPEFRAGLKALGEVGQQAFKAVKDQVESAGQAAATVSPLFAKLQERIAEVGKAGGEFKNRFSELSTLAKDFGRHIAEIAALAVPLGAGGVIESILGGGKAVSELEKAATGLGLTATELEKLKFQAGQADVSFEDLRSGLGRLENKLGESYLAHKRFADAQRKLMDDLNNHKITYKEYSEKIKEMNDNLKYSDDIFDRLHIRVTDYTTGAARPLGEVLEVLRDKWGGLTAAEKAADASALGFQRNRAMLSVLNQTGVEVDRLNAKMAKIAPALTPTELAVGKTLNESVNLLNSAWDSMYNKVRLVFAPATTALIEAMAERMGAIRDRAIGIAQTIVGTLRPVLTDIIKLIAGEGLDPTSQVAQFVTAFKAAAQDVEQAIGIIIAAWKIFEGGLQYVADLINYFFGTNFSGRALAIVVVLGVISGAFGAIGTVIGVVVSLVGILIAAFGGAEVAIGAAITAIGVVLGYVFVNSLKAVMADIDNFAKWMVDIFFRIGEGIKKVLTGDFSDLKANFNDFIDYIVAKWNAVKALFKGSSNSGSSSSSSGSSDDTPAYAGGGAVSGPGSSRSDSILARLSNGEFVVQAAAVAKYGASLFQSLNNMRIPAPAFALGGLVDAISPRIPRFANGGLVAAAAGNLNNTPVILQIGDSKFGPMMAAEHTVTKLQRFASAAQIKSGGRKPSWKGN